MQKKISIETQLDVFATNFYKESLLISYLSTSTNSRSAWYLDSVASRELFKSLMERESWVHVELCDDAKYAMKGERTILF
jgi:hypothetical protein